MELGSSTREMSRLSACLSDFGARRTAAASGSGVIEDSPLFSTTVVVVGVVAKVAVVAVVVVVAAVAAAATGFCMFLAELAILKHAVNASKKLSASRIPSSSGSMPRHTASILGPSMSTTRNRLSMLSNSMWMLCSRFSRARCFLLDWLRAFTRSHLCWYCTSFSFCTLLRCRRAFSWTRRDVMA